MLRVFVCRVRFPGCQDPSVFLLTLLSTELAARERCQRCDVSALQQPWMLFFVSSYRYDAVVVCRGLPSAFAGTGNPSHSGLASDLHSQASMCLFCFPFRVLSKMSMKIHSQSFLKTSEFFSFLLTC